MTQKAVLLDTSLGPITLELYWDHAPKACENFYTLAQQGFYNGVIFHRIIKDFIIQSGDPTGSGKGGQSIYGEPFEDEITPELKHTGAGILSMANSGPNSNTSQFFITLAPTSELDGQNTIFGRVTSGMKLVKRLGALPVNGDDRPIEEVKIVKVSTFEL